MAEMKSLNGYEIVDKTARDDISNIYNNRSIKILNFSLNNRDMILTFSGKAHTRTPAGLIIANDQNTMFGVVPFMLKSDSGSIYDIETIKYIMIPDNDYIKKESDASVKIYHNNSWGIVTVIFFGNNGSQVVVTES